ncbi:hypothetical protein D6833_07225 [Candidatus Parcubacteria bacterium]|nr:MAG: hypothetical protein D6833_07225 [Candidatus Parcubacteria bacterium]
MLHDKWMTYTGEWQGFQAYVHHRAVSFALRGYHLGSSDEEAKHALIFDLRNRQAYIAAKNDAYAFIARQDEPAPDYLQQMKPPDDSVTINDLSHLFQNNIRPSLPSIDDIMADLQSYRAVVEDMLQWLDKHWSANNN